MKHSTLSRIATLSLALGLSTVACTPGGQGGHPASLADQSPKTADKLAQRAAAQARVALAAHQGDGAVAAAEQAVALRPNDAGYRMLLGQAYLADGRFASAEASFRDSLTLTPDQPKARFDLALAQIGQGHGMTARDTLHALGGTIPAGDIGLALALSGDRPAAIAMLTDLVRSGKSDARARQNLALTFALDGRWGEARAVAMQDTTPDKIDAQIAHWAELAKPTETGTTRVAAMLGVTPRADPGVPTELALASPAPQAVAAPVALATADAAPVPQVAAVPLSLAAATPPPAPTSAPTVVADAQAGAISVPLDAPIPAATPANAPATAVVLAAQTRQRQAAMTPPPLLRAPSSSFRSAVLVQPAHASPFRAGGYVVQLGAYSRAGAIQTAWSQASKLMPRLAGLSAARAQFSLSGTSLVRLSVSGFADHDSAAKLCTQIRAKGGACFVRAVAGDAPVQWAKIDKPVQLAAR